MKQDNKSDNSATILNTTKKITIPIKYNKEIKELDLETAISLAQKGMKYEAIINDYSAIKDLALLDNLSVPLFIENLKQKRLAEKRNDLTERCGGDKALAEHILELEGFKKDNIRGFDELSGLFPQFKAIEDIPSSVLARAELKGTLLLDEYLRYRLENELSIKELLKNRKKAENMSLGSQQSYQSSLNPEAEEFLKGLWK